MELLVAFENRPDRSWLGWFKAGFRHCYIIANTGLGWRIVDPICSPFSTDVLDGPRVGQVLAGLAATGVSCVRVDGCQGRDIGLDLRPMTCVEWVKRALGIRNPRIFTPLQLYGYLIQQEGLDAGVN